MRKPGRILGIVLVLFFAACGGGGGGGNSGRLPTGGGWVMGVFAPSTDFDALCVSPRSGIDPTTGVPFLDRSGTMIDENNFLRSWTHELYLWYGEVLDTNPAGVPTLAYFDTLVTPASTPSGQPKDRFHFTFPTAEWIALSQSGVQAGYGATWVLLSTLPPRRAVVAYTDPNSPATAPNVNLMRGADVLSVDGVDINVDTQAGVDVLNAGLFPSGPNQSHTFGIRDLGSQTTRLVTMVSANVTSAPVQNVTTVATGTGVVGYMLFNDHIATAEAALINAVNTLQAASVSDLGLDIRYNGGGFLDIANELAFMIAGPGRATGQTFERLEFNDKYPNMNPVTGQSPVRQFVTTSLGFSPSVPTGTPLPTLNLSRVFVLTGPGTCSASESIINSLRGVDVDVIQIGSTTCGKPYGFYPVDNCGTTYFSIQFRGVNAKNFGEYPDGFSPQNTLSAGGVRIPGCSVADDFTRALGDPAEARFSAALGYRTALSCTVPPSGMAKALSAEAVTADGVVYKSPWLENRILRQ